MPKFSRPLLLGAVEQALAQAPERHAARNAERMAKFKEDQERWFEQHADDWREAVTNIRAKLRKRQPITMADLPGTDRYGRSPDVFSQSAPTLPEYTPSRELLTLREVLTSLADEHVTASALRDLGVNPNALRTALAHLGK